MLCADLLSILHVKHWAPMGRKDHRPVLGQQQVIQLSQTSQIQGLPQSQSQQGPQQIQQSIQPPQQPLPHERLMLPGGGVNNNVQQMCSGHNLMLCTGVRTCGGVGRCEGSKAIINGHLLHKHHRKPHRSIQL